MKDSDVLYRFRIEMKIPRNRINCKIISEYAEKIGVVKSAINSGMPTHRWTEEQYQKLKEIYQYD
ncbi:MAG: hypothetical protein ACMV0Y_06380 [Paludibacter sp.]